MVMWLRDRWHLRREKQRSTACLCFASALPSGVATIVLAKTKGLDDLRGSL